MVRNFNRSAICDAAVELLKIYGFNGFTMQQVAEKTGMAIGNLYNYFTNKEQIMAFVGENMFVSFYGSLLEATKEGNALEKIEMFSKCVFASGIENRVLIKLFEQVPFDIERKQKLEKILGLLHDIIKSGTEKNELAVDPQKAAAYIFSLLIGYNNHVAADQKFDFYPEKEAKEIIAFLKPSLTGCKQVI